MKCKDCGTELVMLVTGSCPLCSKTVRVPSYERSHTAKAREAPCCGTCRCVAIKDDDGFWCSKHDFKVYELNHCAEYEKAGGTHE